MRSRRTEAGFTMVEVIIATGVASLLMAVFASTFATSAGVSGWSTVSLQAHEEHRRNLDAVANAFRGAATTTLAGFDANGNSTAPTFQCVTGIDETGLVLDSQRSLAWRASTRHPFGVSNPGEVVATQNGATTVLARNVPAGGFRVTLLGRTLRISITTYCAGTEHRLATISGDTSLTLRN